MFEKIKRWHKQGLWSDNMVMNAVKKKALTPEQAREIIGH